MTISTAVIEIFVEDRNETLTLQLSSENAEKATTDPEYLSKIVNEYYAAKSTGTLVPPQSQPTSNRNVPSNKPSSPKLSINTGEEGAHVDEMTDPSKVNEDEKSLFIWPTELVTLLLAAYEERADEFETGVKRHIKIYNKIAEDINKVHKCTVTGTQCQTKMLGLRKTYKKILDHNKVSGNNRQTWPYFDRMDKIFGKSGWANPKAVATEAGPSSSSQSTPSSSDVERKPQKRKAEAMFETYLLEMQNSRMERGKERQEAKDAKLDLLRQLEERREKQHQERLEMMRQLVEVFKKS